VKKRIDVWRWVGLIGAGALILYLAVSVSSPSQRTEDMPLNEFIASLRAGQVESVEATDNGALTIRLKGDETRYKSRISEGESIEQFLRDEAIDLTTLEIEVKGGGSSNWLGAALAFLPLLLIVGLVIFFMRSRGQSGQVPGGGITKSGASLAPSRPDVTFADVAGLDEAKQELSEIVDFLHTPERYRAIGARIPKGILLMGAPGTGKTYLAKAVAGEAAVPFFTISGSQFVELYVGVGAARVRDLFKQARENAPCLIFIDEIDAVGRQRGTGLGGGNDEREQTLNQILVELDGFAPDANVIVLAATNRPDILDPALTRAGRFDRQVVLDRPDIRGRLAILQIHARGKRLAPGVELESLAKQTAGLVGADLANLLNEAALLAARNNRQEIAAEDLDEAVDRVIAGPQRKSRILTLAEKRRVAVHEAGHALVAHHLPLTDSVTKISIVPRGMAGGYTRFAPDTDTTLHTRHELEQRLAAFLGGRTAELLFLGDVSTGAEDDIERATRMARQMVTRWGMSTELGPRTLGRKEGTPFLGRELAGQRDYSEAVAEEIDEEIERLVRSAEQTAQNILTERRQDHQRVIELLLDEETLTGEALTAVLGPRPGEKGVPKPPPSSQTPATPSGDAPQGPDPPPPRWSLN
jgi:cell division protease FtsH